MPRLRSVLLLFTTICLAITARADVAVSNPRLTRGAPDQMDVSVASSGDDFLAVWMNAGTHEMRASRIQADGSPIDAFPLLINKWGDSSWTPHVAWNGSTYLIAYERSFRGYVRALSRAGEVGVEHQTFAGHAILPKLASSSAGTVAVARGISGIRIAALDQSGATLSERAIPTLMFDGPFLTSFGQNFLVVWNESRGRDITITVMVISPKGEIVREPWVINNDGSWLKGVAAVGDHAIVIYRQLFVPDNPWGSPYHSIELRARIVTPGSVSEPIVVAKTTKPLIHDAAVTAHGVEFVVTWMHKSGSLGTYPAPEPVELTIYDLHAARLSTDGVVLESREIVASEPSDIQPVIASNGRTLLLCWLEQFAHGSRHLAASLLDGRPSLIRRIDVTRAAPGQTGPRLARARDTALVVWQEDPENTGLYAIHARRMTTSGRFLDPDPIRVSTGRQPQYAPSVAANRDQFLVVWTDREGFSVMARRLSRDGILLDPEPIEVGPQGTIQPMPVASDGEGFVIGAIDAVVLIDRNGRLRRHAIVGGAAAIAWTGSNYLVVSPSMSGMLLDRDGNPVSAAFTIGDSAGVQPAAACNGNSCIVVWNVGARIFGARVIGTTVIPFEALSGPSSTSPRVAASDDDFLVSWITWENPRVTGYGMALRDLIPRPLLGPTARVLEVDTLFDQANNLLLAYSMSRDGAPYGDVRRVFIRSSLDMSRRRAARR